MELGRTADDLVFWGAYFAFEKVYFVGEACRIRARQIRSLLFQCCSANSYDIEITTIYMHHHGFDSRRLHQFIYFCFKYLY